VANSYNQPIPPKLPETRRPGSTNRSTAWSCVIGNLVLPGLGTFVAGRRFAGALQLIVSQGGFLLMLLWAILYALSWMRQEKIPEDLGPGSWLGVLGVVFFVLAWFWSLISSIVIVVKGFRRTDLQPRRISDTLRAHR